MLPKWMQERHSVRKYEDRKIDDSVLKQLQDMIDEVNQQNELHIQLAIDEPKCFHSLLVTFGRFSNVKNYIVLVGKKSAKLSEKCGFFGEQLVQKLQELGLGSCWVAGSYSKNDCICEIKPEEERVCVISFGYGQDMGKPHNSKEVSEVAPDYENAPQWYRDGVDAALLAPTGMNRQKFLFSCEGEEASLDMGESPHMGVDRGIVKYHFEQASGHKVI